MLKDFKKFLLRGNVVDLAVAVVIGAAFSEVVKALVSSLLTPLIAALVGKPDFSNLAFTINKSQFSYGLFLNALIAFLLVAAAVFFFVIVPMNKFIEITKRRQPAEDPTVKLCDECLSEIPIKATRCKFCSSKV